MNYWLLKSEPESYSIDHLKLDKVTAWTGVRNYQARNNMRAMEVGDLCLFYHSSTKVKGVFGVAKVAKQAYPDPTQFSKTSRYFDPKATKKRPIWFCVNVAFVKKFKNPVTLFEIKLDPKLKGMLAGQRGARLSVQPVSPAHFNYIAKGLNRV